MKKKRLPDWDDGRTVADMSGISPQKTIFLNFKKTNHTVKPESSLSQRERWWVALGALRAALLIGLVFAVGLGLVILILVFLWHWLPNL